MSNSNNNENKRQNLKDNLKPSAREKKQNGTLYSISFPIYQNTYMASTKRKKQKTSNAFYYAHVQKKEEGD